MYGLTYNSITQLKIQKIIINTKPKSGEKFEAAVYFGNEEVDYICKTCIVPTIRDHRTGEWQLYSTLNLYQGVIFGSVALRDAVRHRSEEIISEIVFLFEFD